MIFFRKTNDSSIVRLLQGSAKMTEPSKVIHVRNVGHEVSEVRSIISFNSFVKNPLMLLLLHSLKNVRCTYLFIYYNLQNDLLQLVQPFGVVTKLVMLRAKNQVSFSLCWFLSIFLVVFDF